MLPGFGLGRTLAWRIDRRLKIGNKEPGSLVGPGELCSLFERVTERHLNRAQSSLGPPGAAWKVAA
jgi:hypothetical protein